MLKGLVEKSPKTEGGSGPVRMGAEVSEKLQGKKKPSCQMVPEAS